MTQTKLITKAVAAIGEEIGLELGTQMIQQFQESHPSDVQAYLIGRNIIDQILAQPGCAGIQFYQAINEQGEKTLVYVGVDRDAKPLVEFPVVNPQGIMALTKGIVADRVRPTGGSLSDADNWNLDLE